MELEGRPPGPGPARVSAPLDGTVLRGLSSGQEVLVSGRLVAARDQAHKRLADLAARGAPWPFDPLGQIVFYVGPSPAPPGLAVGAAGPTTSGRMDALTLPLLERGVKAFLGKGRRSPEVLSALLASGAVYLAAVGGAGAFYGSLVARAEVLAWPELGPEALMLLEVRDFPATVVFDLEGRDQYLSGPLAWAEPWAPGGAGGANP